MTAVLERGEALRAAIRGDVITPGDAGYEEARRVWNATADARPAAVVRCSGVADVMRALEFARSEDVPLAVRGGGHSLPGHSTCDGGIVIDLGPMRGIRTDPDAGTVRAQGGVRWGELDRETQQFGLATTGGVVSSTGIAGLTLGGGKGWLMRRLGLACDNLLAADVVTADGRLVQASAVQNEDLFWGLRGGGGNFGIATSLEYRVHPVGPVVAGGMVLYEASHARTVFRAHRELAAASTDDLNLQPVLLAGPDGTPLCGFVACHAGPVETGERELAPARRVAQPVADEMGPIPYVVLQTIFDALGGPGARNWFGSVILDALTDEAIELIVGHRSSPPAGPLPAVLVEPFGGAVSRVPADATAYPHRDAGFEVLVAARWEDPAHTDAQVGWVRELTAALGGRTGYVNYASEASDVRSAYGDRLARLRELKRKYDPDNVFRLNQNIAP